MNEDLQDEVRVRNVLIKVGKLDVRQRSLSTLRYEFVETERRDMEGVIEEIEYPLVRSGTVTNSLEWNERSDNC